MNYPTDAPRPWGRNSKPGPWDAIVIGSGIGGMVAAAILSKLGRRVLVLEQHYVPGGFTHTFRRRGYRWDVGLHVVGDMRPSNSTWRLFDALSDGRLKWASLGPVYETFHLPDGLRVDFPDDPRQFRQNLAEAFPSETEAIDRYLLLTHEICEDLRAFFISRALPAPLSRLNGRLFGKKARHHLAATVADVASGLTDDPRLRTMMAAQWAYYGAPPSQASFAMQAMITEHYLNGGYYPVGGASRIAQELLRTVTEAGGWTRIRADVSQIILERGRAAGVGLSDGEEIRAPIVVSAVSALSTVRRLLPETARQGRWAEEIGQLRQAPAHVCLYLGFKGDIRAAGAGPNNLWFYGTWDCEEGIWQVSPDAPLSDAPLLYASFPSLKDPAHEPGPEQRHTGGLITFVPWEAFSHWRDKRWMNRGSDYDDFKRRLQESMLKQLFRRMPGLEPMLDYAELSTPVSTDHFARAPNGSIYGLESTPERYLCEWLRCRTPIPGLFLSGVDVATPGIAGAAIGGMLTAMSVKPLKAYRWLHGKGAL